MDPITLRIPSVIENIRLVESFVENLKVRFSIDDEVFGNIMVAVTESVNNAIQHGNQMDRSKNVRLSFHPSESQLRFIISDEGGGFNYTDLPDPTAPDNLLKPGGRGIFLIRNLSDQVHFDDDGRKIELIFYIN